MTLQPDQIAVSIQALVRRTNPVLFAGAGVGCRAGFPSWAGYVEHLAATCEEFKDPESALLIRKRVEQQNYLGAASVFKTSTLIPAGERWKRLAAPFSRAIADTEIDKLIALVSLPFTAIVTTNYERSLLHAASKARGRWVTPIERDTLHGASLSQDFFVGRIHGNAEDPTSMVVDDGDYAKLREDAHYLDFILHLLTTRSCLFMGFSFMDPAISHVLAPYRAKFGPVFPSLHTALVPVGDTDLPRQLRELNIETFEYDGDQGHADLWRAVRIAHIAAKDEKAKVVPTPGAAFPLSSAHRFMAFTHAQARLRTEAQSISAVAQDGLVASTLSARSDGMMSESDLVSEIRAALRIEEAEAVAVVAASLKRLADRDQILRDGSEIAWVGTKESELDSTLHTLAKDVADRACVREGISVSEKELRAASAVIESVLMARAWDIAAHFAGGNSGWSTDIAATVHEATKGLPPDCRPGSPMGLERSVQDLFRTPDSQEAEALVALGRAAFGVQLLLASPRQTLFHKHALPTVLYLDASVLMPAVTTGHPLRPAYLDVIGRLREAADQAGQRIRLVVGEQFLNEIDSHRKLAIEMVATAGLEDPENLRRHIQFHSAENTNVFVGAYGTVVGRGERKIGFSEFLAQAAPFSTEDQLATFLEKVGVHSMKMDFREQHNALYVSVLNPLLAAFENDDGGKDKPKVLVKHEAAQLTQLLVDASRGESSLFVTADHGLRRALFADPRLRSLSGMTISHLGLVALADVMVGLRADARGLARMIWASPTGDQDRSLFNYFVHLGLLEYHEGLGAELQDLATRSTAEASEAARDEHVKLFSEKASDVARAGSFLDRFEDRFYQYWREALKRHEGERNP